MKLLIGVCVYNEEKKIEGVLKKLIKLREKDGFDIVIGNDGSTDKTNVICDKYVKKYKIKQIKHKKNMGVGANIRDLINYARKNNYEVFTTISGNGKINPKDMKKMYDLVLSGKYDYVKGSRYVKGGGCDNLPLFRKIAIPLFSFFVSILMHKKITDAPCLVNALNLKIFDNKNIDINQKWLEKYELEYYILYNVLKYNYKFIEVPLHAKYPSNKKEKYTKIKPFSGWWSMIRPWILLKFKIKS